MGLKTIKPAFIHLNGELINLNNVIGFAKAEYFDKVVGGRVNKPTLVMQTIIGKAYFSYDTQKERDEVFDYLSDRFSIDD